MPFLFIFSLQFVDIFHRITWFCLSIDEFSERLDGHNDSLANPDGSDFPFSDQRQKMGFADAEHFCRLWDGYSDPGQIFRPFLFRLLRRCPHRNSDAGIRIEWNRNHELRLACL